MAKAGRAALGLSLQANALVFNALVFSGSTGKRSTTTGSPNYRSFGALTGINSTHLFAVPSTEHASKRLTHHIRGGNP